MLPSKTGAKTLLCRAGDALLKDRRKNKGPCAGGARDGSKHAPLSSGEGTTSLFFKTLWPSPLGFENGSSQGQNLALTDLFVPDSLDLPDFACPWSSDLEI